MKKVIVLLAIGFAFTYCNPSQQADQTTTDSSRTSDATQSAASDTMTPSTPTDTTHHPDSTRH